MALSAQGTLWGCVIFPHYLREKYGDSGCQKYCFGDIDSFIKNPQQIYAEKIAIYAELRMDRFSTPERSCVTCEEAGTMLGLSPGRGLTSGEIGKIPAASCARAKILRQEKRRFLEAFNNRTTAGGANRPARGLFRASSCFLASSTSGNPASAFFQRRRKLM